MSRGELPDEVQGNSCNRVIRTPILSTFIASLCVSRDSFSKVYIGLKSMEILFALCLYSTIAYATTVRTATPLMGWNSYNYYGCSPNETIIKENAAGLVELGFREVGYTFVTPDCGWSANYRNASSQLVWNPALFPSGGEALGEYVHGLGLKFGMYSGAGHYQCGSTDQPASLGKNKLIFQWHDDPKLMNLFARL